jgi:hypothetical protein
VIDFDCLTEPYLSALKGVIINKKLFIHMSRAFFSETSVSMATSDEVIELTVYGEMSTMVLPLHTTPGISVIMHPTTNHFFPNSIQSMR